MFFEDLSLFFDVDEGFAVDAIWTPAGGGGSVTIQVIFEGEYYESSIGDAGIAGLSPMCSVADDQVEGIARNDALVINGSTYRVAGIEPDGTGVTRIRLRGPIVSAASGKLILDDGGGLGLDDGGTLEIDS